MSDDRAGDIHQQTSQIAWRELERFFAAGKVLLLDENLNLVEVAAAVSSDDSASVARWVNARQLRPVSDEQALSWYQSDEWLWAVVMAPWVLVQSIKKP